MVPVVKSTFVAKDPALTVPDVLVLRNTETVVAAEFAVARSGFPSPSISPMAAPRGVVPTEKSTFVAKVEVLIPDTVAVNLGKKKTSDSAVRVLTVTVIGPKVAPEGTVTVSCVVVAAVTVAFVAPKYTVLLAGVWVATLRR